MNLSRGRVAATAAAILGIVAFAGAALRPVSDADVWWHLRAGAAALAGRPGAFTEEWSFTAAGRPWINHEWLAEAGLALARQAGGNTAVVVCVGLLMAGVSLLLFRAAWLEGLPAPLIAVGLALAAAVAGSRFVPRPQVFTYLLLALWLERLATARQKARSGKPPRLLFLIIFPALQVLWTNMHGPLIGLGVGSVLILGGALPFLTWRRRLLLVASLLVASLIHPQGFKPLVEYARELGGGGLYNRTIREWLPLYAVKIPETPATWVCIIISVALGIASLLRRDSRKVWSWSLLLLGLAAAPLSAVRNRDIMAIFLVPAAAVVIAPWRRGPALPVRRPESNLPGPAALGAFILAAVLITVPGIGRLGYPAAWPPRPRLSTADFPVAAADFLERQRVGSKIFNAYDYGGYLIDRLAPRHRVFIDGRYFVYGGTIYRDYLEVRDGGPRAPEILDRTGADILLIRYPQPDGYQGLALRARDWPAWSLVFWDDATLVYVRGSAAPPEWLASHAYRAIDPTLPPALDDPGYWRIHFRDIAGETSRAARAAPRASRPLLLLGLDFEYSGLDGDAAEVYAAVLRIDPANRPARESLGRLKSRHPEGLPPGHTAKEWLNGVGAEQ